MDDIKAGIDRLWAEKRSLLIHLAGIPPGSNPLIEEALIKTDIPEINDQIASKQLSNEGADSAPLPLKNNHTPPQL